MLRSIALENFKKHESLVVDFAPGLNVVKGPNYAGKSSLTHAVLFALFGARAVPGGSATLARDGSTDCSVVLTLDLPVGPVTICRTLKNASVRRAEGDLLAAGHDPVSKYVVDQLGLDLKRFNIVSNSRQDEAAALLTLGAPALQRMVEDMAGVDLIDRVIEQAQKDVARLDVQLSARAPAQEDIEACAGRLSAARARLELLSRHQAEAQAERESREAVAAAAQAQIEEVERQNAAAAQAAQVLASAQGRHALRLEALAMAETYYAAAQRRLEALPIAVGLNEIMMQQAQFRQQCAEADESRRVRVALSGQIEEIERWLPTAQQALAQEQALRAPIEAARVHLESCTAAQRDGAAALQQALARRGEARASVEANCCVTCKRPFVLDDYLGAQERFEAANAEVVRLTQVVDDCTADVVKAQGELEALTSQYPGDGWESDIAEQTANLARLREQLAGTPLIELPDPGLYDELEYQRRSAVSTNKARDEAEAEVAVARAARDAAERTLLEAAAELADAQAKVKATGPAHPAYALEAARSASAALQRRLAVLLSTLAEIAGECTTLRYAIGAEEAALRDLQDRAEAHAKAASERALADGLVRFLRNHRAEFLARLWDGVLGTASEFCAAVTGGSMHEVRRHDDAFEYVERGLGRSLPMDAASGAMRAIAGVGLRLGLEASFFGRGGFLMLDEVSAHLNEEHAAALTGALLTQGRQIVMITHRDAEQYVCDQVIDLGAMGEDA